jgi:hypothetical protein
VEHVDSIFKVNSEASLSNINIDNAVHNEMSMAAAFLDIEKAFDTTWHSGLLYKLSKLEFSNSLIKLIHNGLTNMDYD